MGLTEDARRRESERQSRKIASTRGPIVQKQGGNDPQISLLIKFLPRLLIGFEGYEIEPFLYDGHLIIEGAPVGIEIKDVGFRKVKAMTSVLYGAIHHNGGLYRDTYQDRPPGFYLVAWVFSLTPEGFDKAVLELARQRSDNFELATYLVKKGAKTTPLSMT